MSSQSSAASAAQQQGVIGQIPAIRRDLDKLINTVTALTATVAALTARLDLLVLTSGTSASVAQLSHTFELPEDVDDRILNLENVLPILANRLGVHLCKSCSRNEVEACDENFCEDSTCSICRLCYFCLRASVDNGSDAAGSDSSDDEGVDAPLDLCPEHGFYICPECRFRTA